MKDVYHIWPVFYIPLWAAVAQHWGETKVNYNMLQQKWEEGNQQSNTLNTVDILETFLHIV